MATLTLQQGIDSGYSWPIVDDAGDPATLTGYSAKCQVRKQDRPTADLLAELTATIDGSNVVVTWTAEESLLWTWDQGQYDVILINGSDRPMQVVAQGTAVVDRVVTNG